MIIILVGIFLVLHGFVHLLYVGQSLRLFEMAPGMLWPDGSWVFSKLIGNAPIHTLAAVLLSAAALFFAASGIGLFLKAEWWQTPAIVGAALSTLIYILMWTGKLEQLDQQGAVGIVINVAILAAVYFWKVLP